MSGQKVAGQKAAGQKVVRTAGKYREHHYVIRAHYAVKTEVTGTGNIEVIDGAATRVECWVDSKIVWQRTPGYVEDENNYEAGLKKYIDHLELKK